MESITTPLFNSMSFNSFEMLKKLYNNMELLCNNRFALVMFKRQDFLETGTTLDDTNAFPDLPLQLECVQFCILASEDDKGYFRVSFRSKGDISARSVAESFGGGGHPNASGCKIFGSYDEIKQRLINEKENRIKEIELEFEKEEDFTATLYDLENLCFSSTKKQYPKAEERTLFLSAPIFDNDAIFLPHTNSRSVKLIHAVTKKGIQVDYPGFHSIAFWTPIGGEAPFLCIEPWNGAAIYDDEDNEFCHKRDVEVLAVGESKSYELKISVIGY